MKVYDFDEQNDKVVDTQEGSPLNSMRCQSINLSWENLTLTTSEFKRKIINHKRVRFLEEKVILKTVSGKIESGSFTAIIGASGCGKTTLLNVLSNRSEKRYRVKGDISINDTKVTSIESISSFIGFVQQDEVLLATVTPREIFTFVANLRLKISTYHKKALIDSMITNLGLRSCADTRVGNEFLRGLSGGEKKRTSIGAELITNPSILFLDEPTTGLDSKTGLNIIQLLKRLAQSGRTIVASIHQPSTEIYNTFDDLMLMVRGNIIYSGPRQDAVYYFNRIGYPCPMYTNPAEHFMIILSESGMMLEVMKKNRNENMGNMPDSIEEMFSKRVEDLVSKFKKNYNKVNIPSSPGRFYQKNEEPVPWFYQFRIILKRTVLEDIRNPLGLLIKAVQLIVSGLFMLCLWNEMGEGLQGIQNRNGVLGLYCTIIGFVSYVGSATMFSLERPVFIREVRSRTYSVSAFFTAKIVAELPFCFLLPLIFVSLTYHLLGLNSYNEGKFFLCFLMNSLQYFAGSGFGLVWSTFIPDILVVYAIMVAVYFVFFGCAGFFVTQDHIPYFFYPFEYTSSFKYGYQSITINEFSDLYTLNCNDPGCDFLAYANFEENLTVCAVCMVGLGIFFRLVAYLGLRTFSIPKSLKILSPDENEN